MICMDARQSLGVYVIGSLPVYEAVEVREHLQYCPECRGEYHELAALPAILGMISEDEATFGPVQANDAMLQRLLAQVASERRGQRRKHRVLSAVAAVLILIGGGALYTSLPGLLDSKPGSQAPRTVVATSEVTGVKASVIYGADRTGTWTNLRLWGVPSGARCRLVAVGRNGERQVASGWQATDTGTAEVSTEVAMRPEDISRFEIVTQQGQQLVVVPL